MQKAKQAAANFLSKDGKHMTIVDQDVRAHVTEEHVRPHEHEVVTTVIDKEVHQDHHQTRIQPIIVKERAAEQTSHITSPVQSTEYEHGNAAELKAKLDEDARAYRSSSITHETTHSNEAAPMVSGEHIHHHVHEHIQPIIQKEVVHPHTVHRTIPIHERHNAAAIHHEVTYLPAMTLEEFEASNGPLQMKTTHTLREFDGCPGPYSKEGNLPNSALHPDTSSYRTEASNIGTSALGTSARSNVAGTTGKSSTLSRNDAAMQGTTEGQYAADGNMTWSDRLSAMVGGNRTDGLSKTVGQTESGNQMGPSGGLSSSGQDTYRKNEGLGDKFDVLDQSSDMGRGNSAMKQSGGMGTTSSGLATAGTMKGSSTGDSYNKSSSGGGLKDKVEQKLDETMNKDSSRAGGATTTSSADNRNTTGSKNLSQKVDDILDKPTNKTGSNVDKSAGATGRSGQYADASEGNYTYGSSDSRTAAAGVGGGAAVAGAGAAATSGGKVGFEQPSGSSVPRTDTVSSSSSRSRRRSLMDKLNPLKDSDGDGKKGVFS